MRSGHGWMNEGSTVYKFLYRVVIAGRFFSRMADNNNIMYALIFAG
jgi:hypothetical protein